MIEQDAAIARVVDSPKARRAGDRGGRPKVVEVGERDLGAVTDAAPRGIDHGLGKVDADVAEPAGEQRLRKTRVAAGEIEHGVTRLELRPERRDQLGPVLEVARRVGVCLLGPPLGLRIVLLGAHQALRRSGCLRTKRRMPRQCQSVRLVKKLLSVAASQR